MEIKIKVWQLLLIMGIILVAVMAYVRLSGVRHQHELDNAYMDVYRAQNTITHDSIVIDGLRHSVSQSDLVVLSRDNEIKKLKEQKELLKKLNIKQVNTIGELQMKLEVMANNVPPVDTIIIKEGVDGSFLKLPKTYTYSDKWLSLDTDILLNGHADMKATINPFTMNIVLGQKKEGLFKASSMVSSVVTENPYLSVEGMKFAVVDDQRKSPLRYHTEGALVGTLIGAGLALFLVK